MIDQYLNFIYICIWYVFSVRRPVQDSQQTGQERQRRQEGQEYLRG